MSSTAPPRQVHLLLVQRAWNETAQFRGLVLTGPAELISQYRVPGQYLEVDDGNGTRSYYALAAAPNGAHLELLVRRGSASADATAALLPGSAVPAIAVLGQGYPLAGQRGRNLLLVGAGSGIAPLRAVIQQVLQTREDYRDVVLYYGQRTWEEFAYREEFSQWEQGGVDVVPVLSGRPAAGSERRGYVQQHLPHAHPDLLGPNTSALLCGMQAMIDEVVPVLTARGVPRERILLNH